MTKFNSDIILYGGPGSGKGTQDQLLIKKLGAQHVDMGAEIRKLARGRSIRARRIRSLMNAGQLIPVAITTHIARQRLRLAGRRPVIFDGYPRSPQQAIVLDRLLRQAHRSGTMIYLKLPVRVIRERLLRRAKLEHRLDDQNPTAIRRRVQIFQTQARKLLAHYRGKIKVITIDGNDTIAHIAKMINRRLGL